ncbi:trehalose-phosphatase [Cellulomonas fimi]|uniref:trehalose-phosphatase n=1 Tax=Cellulomonas fimi TaxID=1708 RepID=UPI002892A2EE|nr:trehalose-phosphatase [Cellulomonas fimi]
MSTPDAVAPARDELEAALTDLARDRGRRPLLVGLDFDGVLAPLVDDPDQSRPLPAGAAAMVRLSTTPDVRLALVSGRSIVDLHRRADPPVGTVLVGSHGGERGTVGPHGLERDPVQLSPEQSDLLTQVGAGLAAAARGREGVWVQHKPAAAVLHTRMAGADDAETATAQALALAAELDVHALHGKDVVEISVLPVTKGDALVRLRDEVGPAVVLYAGDDVTDEHAFARLGPEDLTIKVGEGETAARLRAADPAELCDLLASFADALAV